MSPVQPPSLGDVLQRAGIVDANGLDGLLLVLRDRLRAGTPASLGRLLLERGVPAPRILAAAASVASPGAIRCDACSTIQPASTRAGREFPCARCGAFLLVLGGPVAVPAPTGPGTPSDTVLDRSVLPLPGLFTPGLQPEPNEDTTLPLAYGEPDTDRTIKFGGVIPLPGAEPSTGSSGTTLPFVKVLPIPGRAPPVPLSVPASELPTGVYLAAAPDPPNRGIGVPPMFHDATAPVPAPARRTDRLLDTAAPTQDDPEADRTKAFGPEPPKPPVGTRNTTAQGPGIPQRPPLRRPQPPAAPPARGRRTGLIIALSILALLAAAGLVIVLVVTAKK